MSYTEAIQQAAADKLKDCSSVLIVDESGAIIHTSYKADSAEFEPLAALFASREDAIRKGLHLNGKRYEVHRHQPTLVYGRTMHGEPETSEGAAVCKTEKGLTGKPVYAVVTYEMPNVSARIVPKLVEFAKEFLEA